MTKALVFKNMSQKEFIDFIGSIAKDDYEKYKILPSLTIAQCILESSWGKSELAQEANALFGIKANHWDGGIYRKITKEEENGKIKLIEADFRSYENVEESIHDHSKFLQKDRYIKVREAKRYKEATKAILEAGYATASNYTDQLDTLIEKYELYKYDFMKSTSDLVDVDNSQSNYTFKLNTIIVYNSDEDLYTAILLSQQHKCPLIKKSDFEKLSMNVNNIYIVGNSVDDKYKNFKKYFN